MTPRDVEKKFLQFGAIDGVRMPGQNNYAFIQYKTAEAASIAVKRGRTVFNRNDDVTVEFSHTKEGMGKRAASGKRAPKRKSIAARKAAAIKKKAIRSRKGKVTARDMREKDKERSPLVLLRRGQKSPSLIGGRSPESARRRDSLSSRSRSRSRSPHSPPLKRRRRSSVVSPHTPEESDRRRDSLPSRKSRSPVKNKKRGPVSPKRRWSSSLSPGPSPPPGPGSRSWSHSLSASCSRSSGSGESYRGKSYSRSPSQSRSRSLGRNNALSDRSRSRSLSASPVFKRRKKRGHPSTPSDPSPPLSYHSSSSLSPPPSRSGKNDPVARSLSPRRDRKHWHEDRGSVSVSPDRDDRSPSVKSPVRRKRKRNRGLRRKKRGGVSVGGGGGGRPVRVETQSRRDSGGSLGKKKKRPPKGIRLKMKARMERDMGANKSKPVSLLDIEVKPAIRPLMELTPIRRPPSPRERPPSPRPLLSRGRSMSMSPTPSPHRQPIDSYRRSPSPSNYSYGGYRGGLYYRQQEMGYRGDASGAAGYKNSGASAGMSGYGGGGGGYSASWERGRLSPQPLLSSGYSMSSASYRARTPPRRR